MSENLTHDANVFRLPDNADPQLAVGKPVKSSDIKASSVGLRIDKPYGQQRLQFELSEIAYRYSNFSFLNFDAFQYKGALQWHLTPRVSGTLSSERNQMLASFLDYRSFQRNVRTTESHRFDADAWVTGGWHVRAAVSQYDMKNSAVFLEDQSYRGTTGEAGLKYLAQSGSYVSLVQRTTLGDYLNRIVDPVNLYDNKFRQSDTELRATWIPNGRSTLNATLTRLNRHHEHFAQRDFSGTAGQLEYVWIPTGKLQLNFSAKREIGAWWAGDASYTVNDTLVFAPTWRVGAKTSVHMRLSSAVRDFRGPVVPVPGGLRSDTVRSAQLGVDWAPLRNATVTASIQRDSRSSTLSALQFNDTIANLSLMLTFF